MGKPGYRSSFGFKPIWFVGSTTGRAYLESTGRELPEFTYKLSEVYGLLEAEFTGSKSR